MRRYECKIRSVSLGDQNFVIMAESLREATIEASKRVINGRVEYVRDKGEVAIEEFNSPKLEDKQLEPHVTRRKRRKKAE